MSGVSWTESITSGKPTLSKRFSNPITAETAPVPSICTEASSLLDGRAGDSRTGPTWTPPVIAAFWIAALASATTEQLAVVVTAVVTLAFGVWLWVRVPEVRQLE